VKSAAAAVVAALLAFHGAGAAEAKTVRAVMHSGLRITDPILTTAYISRDHGYMVYDTLLGMDEELHVKPQMADFAVTDDKLTYTFTLRDGLKWHDGTAVTADDCVASLERWAKRDGMGQKLMEYTASLEAPDARTVMLKLKSPYGLVLQSIAKPSSLVPFMMPRRLAETPADQPIKEQIGSGPFKFVQGEFEPGVKAVYEKNPDYVPRSEPSSWTAGGKVVKVDRVEWVTMPDQQEAIGALQSGAIDFIEQPAPGLLPVLKANDGIEVEPLDKLGYQTFGRMNFLYPPFDNVEIRRAALMALNQKDVLDALIGDPNYYHVCGAIFGCASPLASEEGAGSLTGAGNVEEARKLLAEATYDGTPVVIMAPTDVTMLKAQPVVAAEALRKAGFNVDVQSMDWMSVVTRRAVQKAPKDGGWNMFFTSWVGADILDPISHVTLSGKGRDGGWFGWPDDPEMERLRDLYVRSAPDAQKQVAADIQKRAYDQVTYIPLGEYIVPSAWSKKLTGVVHGPAAPVFWGMDKVE
jgi:peptide/nickel transport system substrate-binding protein